MHTADDVIALFNTAFLPAENTVLVRGDAEPLYLPADIHSPVNSIIFANGFFASALHEIAHWCIAGRERRKLVDYGYWYKPDGRNAEEQAEFEKVEAKPQAVEWAFCMAADFPFQVSVDNLSGIPVDREMFTARVAEEFHNYWQNGFPSRASRFIHVLQGHYGGVLRLPGE